MVRSFRSRELEKGKISVERSFRKEKEPGLNASELDLVNHLVRQDWGLRSEVVSRWRGLVGLFGVSSSTLGIKVFFSQWADRVRNAFTRSLIFTDVLLDLCLSVTGASL